MFTFFWPQFISKNKDRAISWDLMLISTWNFHKLVSFKKGLIILQNIETWATMNKLKQVTQRFFLYSYINQQEANF